MNTLLKKNGIVFGIILGILLVIPTFIGYLVNIDFLLNNYTFLIVFLSVIFIGILTIIMAKKKLNSIITLKECFSTYFVMILTSLFISTTVNYVLFNIVDTDFVSLLKEKQIENLENQRKVLQKSTQIDEKEKKKYDKQFDETITRIKEDNPYSVPSLLKGFVTFIGVFSIFGILLSLLLRTSKENS